MPSISRVQAVILPVLREKLPAQFPGLSVTSWLADVDKRTYPLLNIRRLGGLPKDVRRLDRAVIEMTAYSRDGLVHTEELYYAAREVLWDMCEEQTVTEHGHVSSYFETMGPTQFDSPYDDSWRCQGLIQLGIRPPRGS